MRSRMFRLVATFAAAWLVTLCTSPRAGADVIVNPGYDLFATLPGTSFAGVPFMGVPVGTFNFGGAIGTKGIGNADTIIQRTIIVDATLSGTSPINLLALQLQTTAPTNAFGPLDNYFITLQSARGGPASTGTITINATATTPTTFSSTLTIFEDIRQGSLNGPIVNSATVTLTQTGTLWSQTPSAGAVLITGVNSLLNGTDHNNDFYPISLFTEGVLNPIPAFHVVGPAVPEPGPMVLAAVGGLLASALTWRRRKAA